MRKRRILLLAAAAAVMAEGLSVMVFKRRCAAAKHNFIPVSAVFPEALRRAQDSIPKYRCPEESTYYERIPVLGFHPPMLDRILRDLRSDPRAVSVQWRQLPDAYRDRRQLHGRVRYQGGLGKHPWAFYGVDCRRTARFRRRFRRAGGIRLRRLHPHRSLVHVPLPQEAE